MTERSEPTTGRVRVTLVRSTIGKMKTQRNTLHSMGLRKINSSIDLPDNPSTWGMVRKVHHLVRVEEAPAAE